MTTNPTAEGFPQLHQIRKALMHSLSPDQLATMAAWLGMESLESQSAEVYAAGKLALNYSELMRSHPSPSLESTTND